MKPHCYQYHPHNDLSIIRFSSVHPHEFDKTLDAKFFLPLYAINSEKVAIVPLEPTEEMCDGARMFLLGLEMGIKTFKDMRVHLKLTSMDEELMPEWSKSETSHMSKSAKAAIIFHLMTQAAPKIEDIPDA